MDSTVADRQWPEVTLAGITEECCFHGAVAD
jgi:hypothetical protein